MKDMRKEKDTPSPPHSSSDGQAGGEKEAGNVAAVVDEVPPIPKDYVPAGVLPKGASMSDFKTPAAG